MITLNITNNWELIDVDNGIGGRLNVMWLSPDGVGISTRDYSHMTILNMILEKSDVTDFWDIDYVKEHNVHDVIQLGKNKKDFEDNNLELAKLMESFMEETKFARISGPYRDVEFGGGSYGHASKLLEKRDFVYEYCEDLTEKQKQFIDKVINVYNLSDTETQEVRHA